MLRNTVLRKRLGVFTRMLHGVEKGDVRALHRTRVASRRLRELLPILQVDRELTRKLVRRLRKVTNRLGTVRELDVLFQLLDELHDPGRSGEGAVQRVSSAVSRERDAARARLLEKLPMAELRRLASRLDDIVSEPAPRKTASNRHLEAASRWAVEARMANRANRLTTAMQEAGAVYLPDRLHAVRIALKKLRYAVELRDELAGITQGEDLRALKRNQDLLGRMHDLQVLIDRVRQGQAELPPPEMAASNELDSLVDRLEDDCRRLHARYMRERPALAAICARAVARPRAVPVRRASGRRAEAS